MRLRGAAYATSIAEHFRDQANRSCLIMDSLTRYAMAQREIALAIGEPPATRGYPPSVFARLPQLVERAGNGPEGGGSITAFYTVLTEGDDQQDPIADSARAILDGHVVLSRALADSGHYPRWTSEQSISRALVNLVSPAHLDPHPAFQGALRPLPAFPRSHLGRGLRRLRPGPRPGHCPVPAHGSLPAATLAEAGRLHAPVLPSSIAALKASP